MSGAPVFPIAATIAGVPVVTIPTTDYAALLDCRRRLAEAAARKRAFNEPSKSPIDRDPEVAAYLADRFGVEPVEVIRAGCLSQFGPKRTPSKSAVYRYWARLRGGLPT